MVGGEARTENNPREQQGEVTYGDRHRKSQFTDKLMGRFVRLREYSTLQTKRSNTKDQLAASLNH